jgi:Spondin_N
VRTLSLVALATLTLAACGETDAVTAPAALSLEAATATAESHESSTKTYRVTVANLTTGQPLSPGVFVTHSRRVSLFTARTEASAGIRAIAEDGDPSVAAMALTGMSGVHSVVTTGAPVGIVGGTAFPSTLSFEIEAGGDARFLSLSLMLICTNDGFAGLDGVRLPRGFNDKAVYYADGYDAGTEQNDEIAGSIVPPCFGIGPVTGLVGGAGRMAEDGVVRHHRGIMGIADLTSAHDWDGPVARVTVRRIK